MRVCCITNDVEATSIYGEPYRQDIAQNVRDVALPAVLALYKKYNVRATFFCLASFVKDYPEIVEMIEAEGHEVACHGLVHDSDKAFDVLSYEQQIEHLTAAKKIIEEHISGKVSSFRAPALRVNQDTPKALQDAGFEYDSSVAPQRLDIFLSLGSKHKVAWLKAPRQPYTVSAENMARKGNTKITEVPVSASGLPYISTLMRVSPMLNKLARYLIYFETRKDNKKVVNFLFHPSEAITIDGKKGEIQHRSKHWLQHILSDVIRMNLKKRNLGIRSLELLEQELKFWQSKGYEFQTIREQKI